MNQKKEITLIILIFILILIPVVVTGYTIINKSQHISKIVTQTTNLSEGEIIIDKNINLNNYSSNITIKDGGEYTLTGILKYSVIIDSASKATLNLNNVNISSNNTSAIVGKNIGEIDIILVSNSVNYLSDNGSSAYNGVIYTNGILNIDGDGKLNITGNQIDGYGIATKTDKLNILNGVYTINSKSNAIYSGDTLTINNGSFYITGNAGIKSNNNAIINGSKMFINVNKESIETKSGYETDGGSIVLLGNVAIEKPINASKQYSMCFEFKDAILDNNIISLQKYNNELITFKNINKFSTMIISINNLNNGKYSLFKDGTDSLIPTSGIYENGSYKNGILINKYDLTDKVGSYEVQ